MTLAVFASLLTAAACAGKGTEAQIAPGASFDVYKGDRKVEEIKNAPGALISLAAPPPPPAKLVMHPWLTASSYDIMEESNLFQITQDSKDFPDYVRRLKDAGYRLEPHPEP